MRLALAEKSNGEIAQELTAPESTVKFHMASLLRKTSCKNRLEILEKYVRCE